MISRLVHPSMLKTKLNAGCSKLQPHACMPKEHKGPFVQDPIRSIPISQTPNALQPKAKASVPRKNAQKNTTIVYARATNLLEEVGMGYICALKGELRIKKPWQANPCCMCGVSSQLLGLLPLPNSEKKKNLRPVEDETQS